MKAWRLAAAGAKRDAIKAGTHEKGRRYGRKLKAVMDVVRFKATPSPLFFQLMAHAGLIQLDL